MTGPLSGDLGAHLDDNARLVRPVVDVVGFADLERRLTERRDQFALRVTDPGDVAGPHNVDLHLTGVAGVLR